jgi:hypothetical protein
MYNGSGLWIGFVQSKAAGETNYDPSPLPADWIERCIRATGHEQSSIIASIRGDFCFQSDNVLRGELSENYQ